jgi:DegV family protein with EDD domain
MKFRIVVDSCVYFTEEKFKKHGIKRASLNIIDKDESHKELELENDFVFNKLEDGHMLTTSQPSPGEFLEIYEDLLKEGAEKIFVITLSEPISGTYQSANLARNMLDEPNSVHVFKSIMAAFGNEMLILELIKMIENNNTEAEIINRITKLNNSANLIFTLGSLEHLSRSGRLSKTKAMIGTVLRLKPLIKMINGKLDLFKSERTHKKVIATILDQISETAGNAETIYLRILSQNALEQAKALETEIKKSFKNIHITFSNYLGPVFSLHLGKIGYGVSWCFE